MWTSSTACATQVRPDRIWGSDSWIGGVSAVHWLGFDWLSSLPGWAAEKENLCLYGLPNGGWEVALPAEEVPPEMPEPALGINFARDGMKRRDWLSLVAVHSDAWLVSVAYFYAARLNGNDRYSIRNWKMERTAPFSLCVLN